jgi:hypothetical protein
VKDSSIDEFFCVGRGGLVMDLSLKTPVSKISFEKLNFPSSKIVFTCVFITYFISPFFTKMNKPPIRFLSNLYIPFY